MAGVLIWLAAKRSPKHKAFLTLFPTLEVFENEHPRLAPSYIDVRYPTISVALTTCSSTRSWIAWREMLRSELIACPDNKNYSNLLECANEVLEWRAGIPAGLRFWNEDEIPPEPSRGAV